MNLTGSAPLTLWTIGHSSRSFAEFASLLEHHAVRCIADVRRFPGSRAHPHFNAEHLGKALPARGVRYEPFPDLGGRRKPDAASTNTVWRNQAFRAYADYMETAQFRIALDRLLAVAAEHRTAIMCSEAVWWSCHRSLIADALKVRGVEVLHIMAPDKVTEHPYTSAASIVDGQLIYGSGSPQSEMPL